MRHVTVDDAGRVLNPVLAEGQRHGGIAQGVAQALLEEVRYDPDGNPLTSTLADYAAITATELPSFELVAMETPTTVNPLGVKGIGEAGTIGATPAALSAVVDAVAHLGVRHIDMPATPLRVWTAINEAKGAPVKVTMTVNGAAVAAEVEDRTLLVHFLRETAGLTATNIGCDTTSCGACTVLLDGESVKSCTVLAAQADGHEVVTAEGLAGPDGALHPVQQRVPHRARPAVRLLHPGHGDGRGVAAPGEPAAHRGAGPDGAGRQPVPVHRLPQHRPGGAGRRRGDGEPRDPGPVQLPARRLGRRGARRWSPSTATTPSSWPAGIPCCR